MKMLLSLRNPARAAFVTFVAAAHVSYAADVERCVVEKGIQYFQNDAAQPIADDKNGAIFEAEVKATSSNSVSAAALTLPNALTMTLPPDSDDEFKFDKKYNKQSTLDANFPNGSYTLTINTAHEGAKAFTVNLTGDVYPNSPRVNDFAAAQAVDAGAYFRCGWDPFTGGSSNDFIQLRIEDSQGKKVWETPDLGKPGALDGTAGTALIPSGALAAGQTYEATLLFARLTTLDEITYPGAFVAGLYYKRTKFPLKTTASPTSADVKLFGLVKTRRFEQGRSGAPTPATSKAFTLDAFVEGSATGAVKSVELLMPTGTTEALSVQSDDESFEFDAEAPLQSALDTTFPNGRYTFQISTGAGPKTPSLELAGNVYPDAPEVQGIPQTITPGADLALSWKPFTGGTSDDFIQLRIEDDQGEKVFETPDLGKASALNGRALGVTVPGKYFLPGQTYSARVLFQKNTKSDIASYPGALGMAGYASRTAFELVTSGGANNAPVVRAVRVTPGTGVELVIQAPAGQSIRVETSSDVREWTLLQSSTVPDSGSMTVTDPGNITQSHRFYRAVLAP